MSVDSRQLRSLITQVDEILFNEWDPIGINSCDSAFDEYSTYAPKLLRLAMRGNLNAVVDQLNFLSVEHMGLHQPDREHTLRIAQKLIDVGSRANEMIKER